MIKNRIITTTEVEGEADVEGNPTTTIKTEVSEQVEKETASGFRRRTERFHYFYQFGSVLYTTEDPTEDLRDSTVNLLDNSASKVVSYWYKDFGEVDQRKGSGYCSRCIYRKTK